MRQTPIFQGINRPAMVAGLPMGYMALLAGTTAISFLATNDVRLLGLGVVGYPILWVISDKSPNLLEILSTSSSKTPPNKLRFKRGSNVYVPPLNLDENKAKFFVPETILKEESVNKHIPYIKALTDTAILTKNGDILGAVELSGIDSFTAEDRDTDSQAETFARFVTGLGPEYGFHVSKVTVPHTNTMTDVTSDKFSETVDAKWQTRIDTMGLKRRSVILTICVRPALSEKFKIGQLFSNGVGESVSALEARRIKLDEVLEKIGTLFPEQSTRRLTISSGEWLGVYGTILGQKFGLKIPSDNEPVANAVLNSTLEFDDKTVVIDDGHQKRYAAVFAAATQGTKTWPRMLDALNLAADVHITNSFELKSNKAILARMQLARRQMRAADDAALSLEQELEVSADNVASGRQSYGLHNILITVVADSRAELEKAATEVWQASQDTGASFIREQATYGVLQGPLETAFFSQLPGNWSYRIRSATVSTDNFADFCAFHTTNRGREAAQTPWGKVITTLPSAQNSGYLFNFHEKGSVKDEPSAGHTLILGRPGSGKTLGTAFLLAQAQRAKPRIVVFDKDQSLEMAVRAMGGKYSRIQLGVPTGLNPFQTEMDNRGRAWLTDWLIAILGKRKQLTTVQTTAVTNAVKEMASLSEDLRDFKNFRDIVGTTDDNGELALVADEWSVDGRYEWLFSKDAKQQISLGGDDQIVGLDMTEIMDSDTERSALLAYLFRRIEVLMEDRQPTIIVLEEAWKLLDDDMFVERLHDYAVTMRKKNCILVMLTQLPSQIDESAVGHIITDVISTSMIYPNKQADPEDYASLKLNQSEAEFVSQSTNGSRAALVKSAGDSVILNMDLSALGELLYVLGGGRAGEERAPKNWQHKNEFWKEMI